MKSNHKPNEVWLRASVLGATWAASEIILGSFLQNLRIPFKGNILTAIGMVLMIAAAYRWKEKGLFWRSGLVCALLKTMSPSSVIFGPMIAIFMESLLFGISVRLLGRNAAGFIVGSVLAQTWVFFHKIFNLLIFYGFSIVDVYRGILKFAEKQLDFASDLFWTPLILLFALYVLFGVITAVIGMRIGRKLDYDRDILQKQSTNFQEKGSTKEVLFHYSAAWLIITLLMIIGVLLSISFLPVFAWLPLSVVVITLWVIRYKRAMRQLSRPRFWISFVFITLLAALAITYLSGNENALEHGLMTGLEMNVRAAIVILGFSVLGKELYNPSIRRRMQNSNFRNLNEAVELAFESLPKVLSHLPDAWTFFSQPGAVVRSLISLVDERVTELKKERKCPVFIVSGQIAEGKTTFLRELAAELTNRNVRVGGFIAERQMNEDVTIGYDLIGIARGERIPFLRMNENGNRENQSHYIQLEGAQEEGQKLLSGKSITHSQVILIDEIGRFEIRGGGWSASLGKLLEDEHACLVIAVRTDMVKDVVECFNINSYFQINVNESGVSAATDRIIGELRI